MTTNFAPVRRLSLLIALLSCAPPWAWGQTEPPVGPAGSSDGWRWHPSLFVLGAYERSRGVSVVDVPSASSQSVGDVQPALALGLEAVHSGSRGGLQGEVSVLGREPFDGASRVTLFDGRAHAFRAVGTRWRWALDEALRVERREALPRGDLQRQQAQAMLEYRGAQGPAYRLQLTDRRLRLPDVPALDVTQDTLALGVGTTLGAGTSLEAQALLRRFDEARPRDHIGVALEATRVGARGLLALRYQFTAALAYRPAAVPAGSAPTALTGPVAPPLAAAASELVPEVPLADVLDDEAESWPARQEHLLSLYGSRRVGERFRLTLRAQVRWLREPGVPHSYGTPVRDREPLVAWLPSFDDRRWHLRATLRWRLSRHGAAVVQAAYASEAGDPAVPELVRSQVLFGLQVH